VIGAISVSTATSITSVVLLGLGLFIGWVFAWRAQVRERTLDARERITSIIEIFLLEVSIEDLSEARETLLHKIGEDMFYRRRRIVPWNRPNWYITTAVINVRHKKVGVSFASSREQDKDVVAQSVLRSIVVSIPEVSDSLSLPGGRAAGKDKTDYHIYTYRIAPQTIVLLLMTS